MTVASVAVQIPQPLYQRLRDTAVRLRKPVQELLAETLQAVLLPEEELPAELQAEIASLANLSEAQLRGVAEGEMDLREREAFDALLDRQRLGPLKDDDALQLELLRAQYGRILVRKARAYALLAERGQPLPIE
jgi:hypothetical protein